VVTSQSQKTVDGWLAELSEHGEPLVLDDTGRCLIVADEQVGLALCVPPESGRFFLYADVLAVPQSESAEFYEEILAHNAMPEVTLGLTLSFDRDARAVVGLYSDDIDRNDAVDFRNVIGNMTDAIVSVRRSVDAACARTPMAPVSPAIASGPIILV
jgi:hypothetical protein